MQKLQQVFQDESRRMARKEIKNAITPLLQQISAMKKEISELKKKINSFEKGNTVSVPAKTVASTCTATVEKKKFRITPARIVKMRKALKLSQTEFAKLVGVATLTVSHWEQGKCKPREAQKIQIASLRGIGKRELKKRLAATADVMVAETAAE